MPGSLRALENDNELLFKDAVIYLSEIEKRYLTADLRRLVRTDMILTKIMR